MKEERFDTFLQKKSKPEKLPKMTRDLHVIECILRTSQKDFFFLLLSCWQNRKPEGGLGELNFVAVFLFLAASRLTVAAARSHDALCLPGL